MPANTSPIFALTANHTGQTFVNADGTGKKTVFTAGSNGSLLESISAVSDDTALVNLDVWITLGGTDYAVGTRQVPIGGGNTVDTATVSLLDQTKHPWVRADGSIFLPSGALVKVSPRAAVTAAKTVTVVGHGSDF